MTAKADLTKEVTVRGRQLEADHRRRLVGGGFDTASKKFKCDLKGNAVLPSQLGKGTWHAAYDGTLTFDGGAHFDLEPVAIFAATAVDVDYKSGKLHTAKPVVLNVDNSFGQYFAKPPNITLEYGDDIKIAGVDRRAASRVSASSATRSSTAASAFPRATRRCTPTASSTWPSWKGLSKSTLNLSIDGTVFRHQGRHHRRQHRGRDLRRRIKLSLAWAKGHALQDLGRLRRLGHRPRRLRHSGLGQWQDDARRRQRRHAGVEAGVHRHRQG